MKKYAFVLMLFISIFILSGCFGGSRGPGSGAGIFKSENYGESWEQKVFVEQQRRRTITIGNLEVHSMAFGYGTNRQINPSIVFIGTNNGAWVSRDGAETWQELGTGRNPISSIAVSPEGNNTIFIVIGNQILKTVNGGENWVVSYIAAQGVITSLVIDAFNPNKIYASTSTGDLIRSSDHGNNWRLLQRFDNRDAITQVLIDPNDTRNVYVFFRNNGIWKTSQADVDVPVWTELRETLRQIETQDRTRSGIMRYQAAAFDPSRPNTFFYASFFGLTRSTDGGRTFHDIPIIFQTSVSPIIAIAINPTHGQGIYIATTRALYKSDDGGQTWSTIPYVSSAPASQILINPHDTSNVFMGIRRYTNE